MAASREPERKKLQMFEDDEIVRYSAGPDVPVVGLLRDSDAMREAREMAVIFGAALSIPKVRSDAPVPETAAGPMPGSTPKPPRPSRPTRPVTDPSTHLP
ncbi:MAG: hypothetical protein ACYDDF_10655 [Thermoplasmatota archaeon]